MRQRVIDSKIIYVRFRKDLDDLIAQAAATAGIPKATLVGRVMTEHIRFITSVCHGQFSSLNKETIPFSSLSSSFFVKHGRSIERSLGKPMRITLKMVDEGNMKLAALATGYTLAQFRTAIMVTWAEREGLMN